MWFTLRSFSIAVCLASLIVCQARAADGEPARKLTFEKHIRPIFRAHCFDCHGATSELKGKLDLRLVRFLLKGGESGPVIVPGNAGESYLLERVRLGEMPPGDKRISQAEIALLDRWIASGAVTARPEPETIAPGLGITLEDRAFWSFQPVRRPQVGKYPPEARVRTPIDALLLAAMPEGLSFSKDADRLTLIKRAYFDLTGLPPSRQEIGRTLNDKSGDWYEQLVDRLLESPHYGERWARHWLDVAGYADSEGYTVKDAVRAWAWKYRDYVIRAFNADKPFDRFVIEQLAGDELAGPRQGDLTAEQIELLTASGFLRMAADGTGSGTNNADSRNQVMVDTLKIVSTSMLGLSLACAQCHDHRYDPIPHADYYALRAIFEPALDWQKWQTPQQRQISLYTKADRQQAAELEQKAGKIVAERSKKQAKYMEQALEKELQKYKEPLRETLRVAYKTPGNKRTAEQKSLLKQNPSVNISPGVLYQYLPKAAEDLKQYDKRIAAVRAKKPPEEFLRVLIEPAGHSPETKLFYRGDHKQPKEAVAPAALTVVSAEGERHILPANDSGLPTTGRRLAYARWLTTGRHPLVARVLVNRIWMHHFGRAIVATPGDFGALGVRPTHPKLLDWLADEFVQQGWSLKKLHRTIMLSTAYRQSSAQTAGGADVDPENRFYGRKPIARLEAEALRDRMLAAAGKLDRTLYGPPLAIKEDDAGQVVVSGEQTRRSLYIRVRRSRPVAMLQAFDAPVMETNCEIRLNSTVATQSLMMMNGQFILQQAANLAKRALRDKRPLTPKQLAALPKLPQPPSSSWQFGYGRFDETNQQTAAFTLLPHWTGSSWQGGAKSPDPKLGWVILNAGGGHPGNNPNFAAIRRWVVRNDGVLTITGTLQHGGDKGNGVRGRIVSSRSGLAGGWNAYNSQASTDVANLTVQAGDTIDFITDGVGDVGYDSFNWKVQLKLQRDGKDVGEWDSTSGFHGPISSSSDLSAQAASAWELALCRPPTSEELHLTVGFLGKQLAVLQQHADRLPKGVTPDQQALTNLCQVLLSSNEFLYVD
jgi:hypothetical protein